MYDPKRPHTKIGQRSTEKRDNYNSKQKSLNRTPTVAIGTEFQKKRANNSFKHCCQKELKKDSKNKRALTEYPLLPKGTEKGFQHKRALTASYCCQNKQKHRI